MTLWDEICTVAKISKSEYIKLWTRRGGAYPLRTHSQCYPSQGPSNIYGAVSAFESSLTGF